MAGWTRSHPTRARSTAAIVLALGAGVFALARRTRAGGASARLTRGRIGTRAIVGATSITVFRAARHRRG